MKREKSEGFVSDIVRSVLYAIVATLLLILVFALIVKLAELTDEVIKPVNQVIKVISIFFGLLLGIKKKEKGFKKGLLGGFFFTVLSILIFSLLSSEALFVWGNIIEILIGSVIGAICGSIVITVKK